MKHTDNGNSWSRKIENLNSEDLLQLSCGQVSNSVESITFAESNLKWLILHTWNVYDRKTSDVRKIYVVSFMNLTNLWKVIIFQFWQDHKNWRNL